MPSITNANAVSLGYLPAGIWIPSVIFKGFLVLFRAMFLPVTVE